MNLEIDHRAQRAVQIAAHAGELLRNYFGKGGAYQQKTSEIDLVTQADQESERYIVEQIRESFPDDSVLTEETACVVDGANEVLWVVDPLDGTTNFVHSNPNFAISIGILVSGKPMSAAVYAPVSNEMFHAISGHGAFLNDRRISVSRVQNLSDALLATGFPYNRRQIVDELLLYVRRAILSAHGIRRAGSAALDLCSVACGRIDGFWEQGLKAWDLAAGSLLVTEAGGLVTDYSGNRHDLYGGRTVATNGLVHAELLQVVLQQGSGSSEVHAPFALLPEKP